MAGNPKDSEWYSTSNSSRNRQPIELTLSLTAHAKLKRLAASAGCSRSALVEQLILAAASSPVAKPPK